MTALLLAFLAGAVVGLALGALGGGGSVLAVPALIYLLQFSPVAATTAGLLIVTATSLTALVAHARAGNVRWKAGAAFAAAGLVPAALVGTAAARVPQPVLTGAFAVLAAAVAVTMLRPRAVSGAEAEEAEGADGAVAEGREAEAAEGPARGARPVPAAVTGAGLGGMTGLLGVGGGFLVVPALVNVLGFRMRAAVGTSLLVIAVNSLAALAGRSDAFGALDWALVIPFAGAAIQGARDGKHLAIKVSAGTLKKAFGVALLLVAAFMLVDAVL